MHAFLWRSGVLLGLHVWNPVPVGLSALRWPGVTRTALVVILGPPSSPLAPSALSVQGSPSTSYNML